jgi:hypothetical protein
MAIVQALIAAIARSAGRLLNTVFGWATQMVFGKVPADRQIYLSAIAFGSVLWILVVLGIAFPRLGTFLVAFVPLPESVDSGVVRLVMLGIALVLPGIVGAISLLLKDPAERPSGAGPRLKAIVKGYPFTLGLAVTLVLMTLFAPVLKLRMLARWWTSQHLPVLVESEDYEAVVRDVQQDLREAGWETRREPASWMLRFPTKVLTTLAGGTVDDLVAARLTTLRADAMEVMLHPSDLVINGREADVVHARATLAVGLAFSKAHLTWTDEGNELEDRIRGVWSDVRAGRVDPAGAIGRLRSVEAELRRVELPYEEWEVLFRARMLVEVAARDAAGEPPTTGLLPRAVVPLAIGVVHRALENPAVRAALEDAIVQLLRRVVARRPSEPTRPVPSRADRPARAA